MVSTNELKSTLSQFSSKSTLVLGDIMLDEFHWCEASRMSPEAPVPVCRVIKTTLAPGGAGNVAANLTTLGTHVSLCATIGKDSSGDKLLSLFNQLNIDTSNLLTDLNRPTCLKSRIIANKQHVARVDREEVHPISTELQKKIIHFLTEKITAFDAILISDYLKGFLPKELVQEIIKIAKNAKKPVIIDPKGKDYSKYKGATLLTPNFSEFLAAVKDDLHSENSIRQKGLELVQALELEALVVTRSEKGLSIIKNNEKIDIPTKARDVYDITGAGDTFIATLTAGISTGAKLETAATIANFAAGIVVGKVGTATTTQDEILKAFANEA